MISSALSVIYILKLKPDVITFFVTLSVSGSQLIELRASGVDIF